MKLITFKAIRLHGSFSLNLMREFLEEPIEGSRR